MVHGPCVIIMCASFIIYHHKVQVAKYTNVCTLVSGPVGIEKTPPVQVAGDDRQLAQMKQLMTEKTPTAQVAEGQDHLEH